MDTGDFKIGACALAYKGTVLGAVVNGPVLKLESTYRNITCDQTYDQPIRKKLLSTAVTLTANIREIDTGMGMLLDGNGKITILSLGKDTSQTGGELLLIPFNLNDTTGYRLPNAVLSKKTQYSFTENKEHSLELEFEGFMNENGVMMEKFTVTDDQRITMSNTTIDPAQIERALTKYIAEKLDLTVDKDIFRGGIFPGKDGFGVAINHEKMEHAVGFRTLTVCVECRNRDRDHVFRNLYKLAGILPVYGVAIEVNGETIVIQSLQKDDLSLHLSPDGGALKTIGLLSLVAKV